VHRQHPAYGHRRVALQLGINHKRAQRVMAQFNLRPPRRHIPYYSTVSTPDHTYHNLLKHITVTQPHHVWCSDLSRLVYRGTIWYLATIEDRATRQIITVRLGKRHNSHLVLATVKQALSDGQRRGSFIPIRERSLWQNAVLIIWNIKALPFP
jgi:transposase InsO family protein